MLAPLIERQQIVKRRGGATGRGLYPVAVMHQKPAKRYSRAVPKAPHFKTKKENTGRMPHLVKPSPQKSSGRFVCLRRSAIELLQSRRKELFIFGACLIILLGLVTVSLVLLSGNSAVDTLSLPEDGSIESILFDFVSPQYEEYIGEDDLPAITLLTAGAPRSYTVKRNDTIAGIAKAFGLDPGTLISYNQIQDVRRIAQGMELKIPSHDGVAYRVRRGDSLSLIAKSFDVKLNDILDMNNLDSDVIRPGMELFIPGARLNEYEYRKAMGTLVIYPTKGRLTSGFGYRIDPFAGVRRMHYGIDLAGPVGTSIVAAMDGTVALVDERPFSYGKYILIKHSGGLQTLYGHLSEFSVRTGAKVKQGQKIGEMGNTGLSTGPHLHFAIYKNNIPVDPLKGYLK